MVLVVASWAVVLVLAGGLNPAQAQNDAIVRLVFFYRDDCAHCMTIIDEILLPLQEQHSERLQIKMIQFHDPSRPGELDPAKYEMLLRAEEMFNVSPERRGIPTVVVGGQVLIGEDEIREQLPCLIDTCLSGVGTSWPDIAGLEAIPVAGGGSPNLGIGFTSPWVEGEELCSEDEAVCDPGAYSIWAVYFYQVGCQECDRAESDIQYVRSRYPQLLIEEMNIYERVDLAQWLAERAGRKDDIHTPALFIGDDALIGQKEITPQNIEALVNKYASTGVAPFWEEYTAADDDVKLPEVMTVVVAGLIDGLNPCAFATLIFFISYLTFMDRKGKAVLAVGGSFTLGVFLAYVLVGIGLWRLLSLVPFLTTLGQWVIGLTAVLCIVLAVLSLRDYFKARQGQLKDMALVMPEVLRKRTHAVIRQASGTRVFTLLALPVGAVVSLLELVCTGQIYLPTIIFVMSVPGLQSQAMLFLLLYNLMFILPLVAVFVLVYFGTTSMQLGRFMHDHAAKVKLGTAVLFSALAIWLIVSVVV